MNQIVYNADPAHLIGIFNDQILVNCYPGFALSNDVDVITTTCMETGEWSHAVDCSGSIYYSSVTGIKQE